MINNGSRPTIEIAEIGFTGEAGRQGEKLAFELGRLRPPKPGMAIVVAGVARAIATAERLPSMPATWWLVSLA